MSKQTIPDDVYKRLKEISNLKFETVPKLKELLKELEPKKLRTQTQSDSMFLWFGQIEKLAENEGMTWNMIIQHTHQLKITKDGLHMMCKQLIEPLFGIKSTKDIEKTGHLDEVIDHFVDLFSKEGLELPPFPSKEKKEVSAIESMIESMRDREYPESHGEPTI